MLAGVGSGERPGSAATGVFSAFTSKESATVTKTARASDASLGANAAYTASTAATAKRRSAPPLPAKRGATRRDQAGEHRLLRPPWRAARRMGPSIKNTTSIILQAKTPSCVGVPIAARPREGAKPRRRGLHVRTPSLGGAENAAVLPSCQTVSPSAIRSSCVSSLRRRWESWFARERIRDIAAAGRNSGSMRRPRWGRRSRRRVEEP